MKEEPKPRSGKFTVEFSNIVTKIGHIWYYDLDKFPNGPYATETIYPDDYKSNVEEVKLANKKVPLTKRTWTNPANGKEVGYTRARALGLIK